MKKIITTILISSAILLPLVSSAQDYGNIADPSNPQSLPLLEYLTQNPQTNTNRNLSYSPSCVAPWTSEPTTTPPTEQNQAWENEMQLLEQSNASYLSLTTKQSAQGEQYNPQNVAGMIQQTQNENNIAVTSLCSALSYEQQYCPLDQQYQLPSPCPTATPPTSSSVFTPDGTHPYANSLAPGGICDPRYYDNDFQCVPLPTNAYATTTGLGWLCDSGYFSAGGIECVAAPNQQAPNLTPSTVIPQNVNPTTTSAPVAVPSPSNTATFTVGANLRAGSSGTNVTSLQKFLESKGFLTMPAGASEGYFGNLTKQALVAFQNSVALPATGYCGPMTRAEINTGS
jgi:peptidoglycan hydrolase-like protein with peptidoglycan-binding domain